MFKGLLDLIASEAEAKRAFDDAVAIQSMDRWFTSSSFHNSAAYSAHRMREAGLGDVEILEAPADGRSVFGDWKNPLAWEAEEATFDLVFPNGSWQRIADREAVPQALAMWSGPTPAEGVEAEIVLVDRPGDGSSYSPEAVRGKIVFTSTHPHHVKKLLADLGAVGILSDYLHPAAQLPEATAWINSFSDDPGGWGLLEGDSRGWAFLISPRAGEKLRARIAAGEKLRGRARVRSSISKGSLPAITGLVPGSGKEEVVLIGHQFEGGAIDNASGVAAMMEAARLLQKLISEGRLPVPTRSIRLLFVSECYSNIYFWEKTRRHRRTVAGLCLDSPVGAPALAQRAMDLHANPHANMSFTDALLAELTGQVMAADPLYAWRETSFSMTDNLIADTSINIPCPWIGGHSRTWHTSADTPEVLPVGPLGLVAQITAAYAYLIASAGRQLAIDFSYLAAARGKRALAAAGTAEMEGLAAGDLDDAMLQVAYLAERQAEAAASAARLAPVKERAAVRQHTRALQRDVRKAGRAEAAALARAAGRPTHTPAAPEPAPALAEIRPRRLVLGPLAFDRLTPAQRGDRPSPRWSESVFSLLNWCNGKRSLAEACELAAREVRRGRTLSADELAKQMDPGASSVLDYFEFLRQHEYVSW
jgi:hypothetical protein